MSGTETAHANVDGSMIKSSQKEILLGINLDSELKLEDHVNFEDHVVLRSKMHVYRKIDRLTAQHDHFAACDKTCCKGTKKCVVSEGLRLMTTRLVCLMVKRYTESKCCLRTWKDDVYTVNKYKIDLNRDDDNRVVQADGITTLARGYVAILA